MKQKILVLSALLLLPFCSFADNWTFYRGNSYWWLTDNVWEFQCSVEQNSSGTFDITVSYCSKCELTEPGELDFSKPITTVNDVKNEGVTVNNCQIAVIAPKFGGSADSALDTRGEKIASLKLPNTVKTIEIRAFTGCKNLVSVEPFLPDSVTTVKYEAFKNCPIEGALTLNGCTKIGLGAFKANKITSASLPAAESISETKEDSTIRGGPFEDCTELTSVTLGNNLTRIGYSAFKNCTSLTTVTPLLPDSVKEIYGNAFYEAPIEGDLSLVGIEQIRDHENFKNSKITSLFIGKNMKRLGEENAWAKGTFSHCTALKSISIHPQAHGAFYGEATFYKCTALTGTIDLSAFTTFSRWPFYEMGSITTVIFGKDSFTTNDRFLSGRPSTLKSFYFKGPPPSGDNLFNGLGNDNKNVVFYANRLFEKEWKAVTDNGELNNESTWTSKYMLSVRPWTPPETITCIIIH